MEVTLDDGPEPTVWGRLLPTPSIRNFRDMGNYPTIDGEATVTPGRLFRSATPEDATEEDAKMWVVDKKIQTWIDLRARNEIKVGELEGHYNLELITRSGEVKDVDKPLHVNKTRRTRYNVDMDLPGSIKSFFKKHATPFEKICMIIATLLMTFSWRQPVFFVVRMFYGRVGLFGLYATLLEGCGPQLCTALKIVAETDGGVVVNCMLGKDRTGTLSALILAALNVPTERIAFDYSLTSKYLSREYISAQLKAANLDTDEIASSTKQTMSRMLDYLVTNYGGVEQYFDSIGFDASWREKLRANFLTPTTH